MRAAPRKPQLPAPRTREEHPLPRAGPRTPKHPNSGGARRRAERFGGGGEESGGGGGPGRGTPTPGRQAGRATEARPSEDGG